MGAAEEAASKNGRALNKGGRPATPPEVILNALFYRLRNAGPWRDLPTQFGPWRTVYGWYQRWAREGLWARLLRACGRRSRGKLRLVDGTHIPVHQSGSNPRGGAASQAMGKTRGGRNTKVMALTDSRGRLLSLAVVAGQNYEGHHVLELLARETNPVIVVGDKAYDDDGLRAQLAQLGHHYCVPPRSNRLQPRPYHRGYYRKRHRIENLFCRLKHWNSIAMRRDKLARHFQSLLEFAAVLDWLRP